MSEPVTRVKSKRLTDQVTKTPHIDTSLFETWEAIEAGVNGAKLPVCYRGPFNESCDWRAAIRNRKSGSLLCCECPTALFCIDVVDGSDLNLSENRR